MPRFTDRLTLGRTGIAVSPLCVGMVESPDTIGAAFDAGINFFFLSADMHWPYYEPARRGLVQLFARGGGVREQVIVAAACYPTQPEFCAAPFLEVIEAVDGLERIDVAVMGGVYGHEFPARLAVYEQHRRDRFAGIQAIGATFHERAAAPPAIAQRLVDVAFARYNPEHTGALVDLFPELSASKRVPLFNFKSTSGHLAEARMMALGVGRTKWRPHITDYYRFALTRPEIDGLLCAPATPGHVADLRAALRRGPLDADEESYLIDLAALDCGLASLARSRRRRAPKKGSGTR